MKGGWEVVVGGGNLGGGEGGCGKGSRIAPGGGFGAGGGSDERRTEELTELTDSLEIISDPFQNLG